MKGWLAIGAVVAAYDGWAAAQRRDTLSRQFKVASRSHPVVIAATTTYLVLHLYGAIPSAADPFTYYSEAFRLLG